MKTKNVFKLSYLFYTIVLLIHILIITKIIPFTWINGGRSESYNAQMQLSMANLAIVFLGYLYVFANQRFQKLNVNKLFQIVKWSLVPFWVLILLLQLLGTPFEKFVMSPIVLFGVVVHYHLARLK